jgi:4-diphosphocytidyl-2-C-methyl-D-erythritol kinase
MTLRAHAKINLSLAVDGVRPDGYHRLRTVFQSLALHDTLRFFEADEGLAIACSAPGVPLDERNLVWKAARLVWAAAGRRGEPRGRVRLTKRIPAQGGLGGGSADGAAALVGWDRLWGTRLPIGRLRALARELGADVPFFLYAGTALGLERGDEIHPLDDAPSRWVVLVFPPFGVSTPEAFRWWDEDHGTRAVDGWRLAAPSGVAPGMPRAASHEPALGGLGPALSHVEGPQADRPAVFNDLEAPVSRRHRELAEIRRALEGAGAEAAAMTGSGSTVFGLFRTSLAARAASDRLTSAGWRTMVTRTATRLQAGLLVG